MNADGDDGRTFRRFCREGMLFEVQDWIRSGKAVPLARDPKEGPLTIAAGKGFHSLVKLLCDMGQSQTTLDEALAAAVAGGNLGTAELLLHRGATVAAVDAREAFSSPNVEIVGLCSAAGADLSTNAPLARELIGRSETALRCFERWHADIETVRDQGAIALISLVRDNHESWVTRLVRAGASPRRRVLSLDPRYEEGPRCTALEQAAREGTFKMLLRLGARKSDDLQALLKKTCWEFDLAKMKFLLRRGAKLNDKSDGGSSVLQECLRVMGVCDHLGFHERSRHAWEAVVELAGMGARWVPTAREMFVVRCGFRHADTSRCIEFATVMLKTRAADHATLAKLFGSPRMKERLMAYHKAELEAVLGEKWWQPRRGRRNR